MMGDDDVNIVYILNKNINGAEEDPAKYVIQLMFY